MKKNLLIRSNFYIIVSTLICYIAMTYSDAVSYYSLLEDNVGVIVHMAGDDISSKIENLLNSELAVSKAMANDIFLKDWISGETQNSTDQNYLDKLYDYLKSYEDGFQFSTVFFVSSATGNYYYQDGLHKTISKDDEHDIWYYNLIEKNVDYDIQTDTSQINSDQYTIFINYCIYNDENQLLGIVGVSIQLDYIQEMITYYENEYNLKVYLINHVNTSNSLQSEIAPFISKQELQLDLQLPSDYKLAQVHNDSMYWYNTEDNERHCIVDNFNELLQWNIIVEKDTESLSALFVQKLYQNFGISLVIVFICCLITVLIFIQYNRKIVIFENIDDLTGIPNRKLFTQYMKKYQGKRFFMKKKIKPCIFLIDIDDFKHYNDSKGHLYGNMILSMVGTTLKGHAGSDEVVARWGGDEFIGFFICDIEEATKRLQKISEALKDTDVCDKITLSIGIAEYGKNDDFNDVFAKADQAMYNAKKHGKNGIEQFMNDK